MKNSTFPGPAAAAGSVVVKWLLCGWLLLAGAGAFAQQTLRVTGSVADDTGSAVVGASVVVQGTQTGTTTDVDGKFALNVPAGGATLSVSFIGYVTQEIPVTAARSEVQVVLASDRIAVDEVVVVGYGEQTRRSITSSVAKLDGESLANIPISSPGEGLKGKIAGLRVTQTNFTPGGGFSYQIRGGSSINGSNSPLVLVDGVERDFSAINPNDIASIDVLKDAASSAIYGAKASNGIILVTTKRGGYNKAPRITFEANWAYQNTEPEIGPYGRGRIPQRAVARFGCAELPERTPLGRYRQQTRRQVLDALLQSRDRRAAGRLPHDARPDQSVADHHVPRHRLAGSALQRGLVAELLPGDRRRRRTGALFGQPGLYRRRGRGPLDGV